MKKHILILSFIIGISSVAIISSIGYNKTENQAIEYKKEEQYYILKDFNGRIALFTGENQTPNEIYNIFTDSLPQADREKIKNGIKARNESELQKTLEAYLS